MEAVEDLLRWAIARGIVLNGIKPEALPGRGFGLTATRKIEPDETILTVPSNTLRTLANTPKSITSSLPGATVHAILTTSLCLETSPDFQPWKAVLPSQQDITISLPLSWPSHWQSLLPPSAKKLLAAQQAKFESDWALVSAAYPDDDNITRDIFLYNWLLVNTRTFYHTTRKTQKLPKEDHMVLQPVADLFNHSPDGCSVAFSETEFTITTSRSYQAGDELCIRYGTHSNDFLLVEYGFTLPLAANLWDETSLDDWLCPLFEDDDNGTQGAGRSTRSSSTPRSERKKELLEEEGFWRGYMLDKDTVCYRTLTALRLLVLHEDKWRAIIAGERDEDDSADVKLVNAALAEVLKAMEEDVSETLRSLDQDDQDEQREKIDKVTAAPKPDGEPPNHSKGSTARNAVTSRKIRTSLRERWLQIAELVASAIGRLEA